MEKIETEIITFNGAVGVFSDEVVQQMREKGKKDFDHFEYVSLAQLIRSSNTKSPYELLIEYGEEKKNLIISYPNAYDYLPYSFKVFFVGPNLTSNDITIIQQKADFFVVLDKNESVEEAAANITVAYGLWIMGRKSKQILQ